MKPDEPTLWKTGLAIPVALLVWTIASSIVSVIDGLANELLSNDSELLMNFWCQVVGGGCGVVAAKWVCDKWLKPYSHHVIFIMFITAAALVMALQFYVLHVPIMSERTLDGVANFAASLAAAYFLFWKNQDIN